MSEILRKTKCFDYCIFKKEVKDINQEPEQHLFDALTHYKKKKTGMRDRKRNHRPKLPLLVIYNSRSIRLNLGGKFQDVSRKPRERKVSEGK